MSNNNQNVTVIVNNGRKGGGCSGCIGWGFAIFAGLAILGMLVRYPIIFVLVIVAFGVFAYFRYKKAADEKKAAAETEAANKTDDGTPPPTE